MAIYSDLNSYSPNEKNKLTDAETVYQSLYSILNTRPGERIFNPEFGCDFESLLFELITPATALRIQHVITNAIQRWETRATLNYSKTRVVPDPTNNRYLVTVYFTLKGVSDQSFQYKVSISK